jgi:methanogenic corrinoid protein MtbC1
MNNFAVQLKKYRKRMGYSQKALAEQMGVGQTTIANYERGTRMPHPTALKELAQVLNVQVDDLLHALGDEEELNLNELGQRINRAVLDLNRDQVTGLVQALVKRQVPLGYVYEYILVPVLHEVGQLWENGTIDVYNEHAITHLVEMILGHLQQAYPQATGDKYTFTALTIQNEDHVVAMKMLTHMMAMEGWSTHYLGNNLTNDYVMKALGVLKTDVLSISCTMDDHVVDVAELISRIRQDKALKDIHIIVGGQAFEKDKALWLRIGADALGQTIEQSVASIKQLVKAVQNDD